MKEKSNVFQLKTLNSRIIFPLLGRKLGYITTYNPDSLSQKPTSFLFLLFFCFFFLQNPNHSSHPFLTRYDGTPASHIRGVQKINQNQRRNWNSYYTLYNFAELATIWFGVVANTIVVPIRWFPATALAPTQKLRNRPIIPNNPGMICDSVQCHPLSWVLTGQFSSQNRIYEG